MVSLKSSSSVEFEIKKSFLNFDCYEELLRFKFSFERGIVGSHMFTFSVIFVRINNFYIKNLIQSYLSCSKMHQFGVPKRKQTTEKSSSALREICYQSLLFEFTIRSLL